MKQELKRLYMYIKTKDREEKIRIAVKPLAEKGVEVFFSGGCTKDMVGLNPADKREVLCITDIPEMAAILATGGYPVAAYVHEENSGEDFFCVKYIIKGIEEVDGDYFIKVFQRLTGQPWDIIETSRCMVREMTIADVDVFYQIYMEPSITRYMESLFADRTAEIQYTKDYIEKVYGFYGFGLWTVILKETGEVIGRAGLSMREGFEEPELGFVIGVPWQGQGLGYEVCAKILEYGKRELGFSKVQAFVEPENEVSLGLCRKLGFGQKERICLNNKEYSRLDITL